MDRAGRERARRAGEVPKPVLANGEVYVTNGRCYHEAWCDALNGVWLSGADTIRVLSREEARAAGKEECGSCVPKPEGFVPDEVILNVLTTGVLLRFTARLMLPDDQLPEWARSMGLRDKLEQFGSDLIKDGARLQREQEEVRDVRLGR